MAMVVTALLQPWNFSYATNVLTLPHHQLSSSHHTSSILALPSLITHHSIIEDLHRSIVQFSIFTQSHRVSITMREETIIVHGIDAAQLRGILERDPNTCLRHLYDADVSMKNASGPDKITRPPRHQRIFSMAETGARLFRTPTYSDDPDLDRHVSPALQTTHIFSHEHLPTDDDVAAGSPFSLSVGNLPIDSASPGQYIAAQPAVEPTASKHADAAIPPRKSSITGFFSRMRDIPKNIFNKSPSSSSASSSQSEQPSYPRSTCPITAEQLSPRPAAKRRPTAAEKDMARNQKAAERYIKRKTKKRLRQIQREQKSYQRKLAAAAAKGEPASIPSVSPHSSPGHTNRILQVVDDAKEKYRDWRERRDEKLRRKSTRTFSVSPENRRRGELLVPVDRQYEVVERRGVQDLSDDSSDGDSISLALAGDDDNSSLTGPLVSPAVVV
ncbi:hypothetical protein ABW21_db0207201 [Orbilia brochopaga]|nr:hypothetical protein ABW21_db0207201 [Drechslerella brochopaga]